MRFVVLCLVPLLMLFTSHLEAQNPANSNQIFGSWKIKEVSESSNSKEIIGRNFKILNNYEFFLDFGNHFNVKRTENNQDLPFTFGSVNVLTAASANTLQVKEISIEKVTKRSIKGKLTFFSGSNVFKTISFTGIRQGGVWLCGNHAPSHTAENAEERKKMSEQHKCKRWHYQAD